MKGYRGEWKCSATSTRYKREAAQREVEREGIVDDGVDEHSRSVRLAHHEWNWFSA